MFYQNPIIGIGPNLYRFECENKKYFILDPFCGVGTTNLVSQSLGYKSIGFDINPVAFLASDVKTHYFTSTEVKLIKKGIKNFKPTKSASPKPTRSSSSSSSSSSPSSTAAKPQDQIRPGETPMQQWARLHPNTKVLQPDAQFKEQLEKMDTYDKGKSNGELTKRDTASWKDKSWVIGIQDGPFARTYDWNQLTKQSIIQDSLPNNPIVIFLENDTASFHT